MPFSNLIGNEFTKSVLLHMAEQKNVPNTLLFYGPDGVGKGQFAIALAKLLMGKEHTLKLSSQTHPDLYLYRPEGKSAIHTMDNIRQLIDEAALPPYEAPVKVFILHDAHQMLPYSSNALLKILEEPPLYCYFILLTSSIETMLPTLTSRCRKIPFFPISQSLIESLVRDNWQKTAAEACRIAFLSHGSLSKAAQLVEPMHFAWRHQLLEILLLQMPYDYPQFLHLVTELEKSCGSSLDEEKDEETERVSLQSQADAIFEEIIAWYRDLHLLKEGIAYEYLYHLDCIDRLQLALKQPFPPLEKVLEQITKARLALQRNVRLRTVIEHFFLSC